MAQLMPLPLTVSCFSKIQIGCTFLVPAHLGSPRQRTVKRVYVIPGESALCRWMRAWCGCKILSLSFRSATICLQKLRKPSRELGHSLKILRHQDRYALITDSASSRQVCTHYRFCVMKTGMHSLEILRHQDRYALITDSASSRQVCGFAHGTKVCWNRPT